MAYNFELQLPRAFYYTTTSHNKTIRKPFNSHVLVGSERNVNDDKRRDIKTLNKKAAELREIFLQ